MRFLPLTILSLAAITYSKPLETTENGDLVTYYLTKLSKVNIVKKGPIKRHIFELMQDKDSALIQHLAEICHSGDVDKLTNWSNAMKVRYNKSSKNADMTKQLQGIARSLGNKINHCTRQYTEDNGGVIKPGMPFAKVLEELFGVFLKKDVTLSNYKDKIDEIKNYVNQNIIEKTQDLRMKVDNVINNWITDDLKDKASSYVKELKSEGVEKVENTKKSFSSKIGNLWGQVTNFFSFGAIVEKKPIVEEEEILVIPEDKAIIVEEPSIPEADDLPLVIYSPENTAEDITDEEKDEFDTPTEESIDEFPTINEEPKEESTEELETIDEEPTEELNTFNEESTDELDTIDDESTEELDTIDDDPTEEFDIIDDEPTEEDISMYIDTVNEEPTVEIDNSIPVNEEDQVKINHDLLMQDLLEHTDEVPAVNDIPNEEDQVKINHDLLMQDLLEHTDEVPAENDIKETDTNETEQVEEFSEPNAESWETDQEMTNEDDYDEDSDYIPDEDTYDDDEYDDDEDDDYYDDEGDYDDESYNE